MMKNKLDFLRARIGCLYRVAENIELNVNAFADHEMYAKEFSDFTNRLEACLRDLRKIRADIGDKADELGGE